MAESLLERTKELCRLYGIKPARSRGQNFLIREEIYARIAGQADLNSEDTVLEVGPGLGFLTAELAKRARRVTAVEIDRRLAEILRLGLTSRGVKNVEVIEGDILKFVPPAPAKGGYKIVANLPFNITSIFLRKFLAAENKPRLLVLLLQKEVAERITAGAGEMSLLAASVQFYARAELKEIVAKENFWPEPEVDSALLKITPRPAGILDKEKEKDFFRLVRIGFSARRKMLKNNLAAGLRIEAKEAADLLKRAGLDERARAQDLAVADWLKLFNELGPYSDFADRA